MSNFTSTIQGEYPLKTFQTLRDLWWQMVGMLGIDARLVTDEDVALTSTLASIPKFSAIASPTFNALLIGKVIQTGSVPQIAVEITFTPTDINLFLQPLINDISIPTDSTNDSQVQSHFTQLLLTALNQTHPSTAETILQQQLSQSQLLNSISTQIHQSLNLEVTLQSAIEQVRELLAVDRLIIYQFEFEGVHNKDFDHYTGIARVSYQAIASPHLSSVLNVTEPEQCFATRENWARYQDGMSKSVESVDREYAQYPCLLKLLQQYQIQSQSIIPIVVKGQLWGLLIAHQCEYHRQWEVSETEFLAQVAQQLAFAIHQSELALASQLQTQHLEQRVNDRTQELRDAVIVSQTANQSKTEFLALLSHELRTPLTSILGLSATLLRLPSLNLTDRQQNYLQTIHNSGEHLSELIDDILDFYKLEVGKTFLKITDFSLSRLVKQVVEMVRGKAEIGKIDLQLQIINDGNDVSQISGRDLRFHGDTKRIRQVLLNILANAIKFTPEDGTVILRVWLEEPYAIFEIEDSGIGIEAEQIPRLFKKFHQLNPNYDRDFAGMGLGLAITQQLVELHGGWIDVDSIMGSGSTFTVRLASQPLQRLERNDWDELDRKFVFQDPELNPTPKRIILIEQDEDIANFLCDILTAARYQVTWLLSAESSFRQISMFKSDLLIIDLTGDGHLVDRLVYNIRKSTTIPDMKILAIAAKEDTLSPTVKEYVNDYLWKQINPEQLLRKITQLISQQVEL